MREKPSALRFWVRFLLSVILATTATPSWAEVRDVTPEEAAEIEGFQGETRATGRATLGGRVGEHLSEGYLDVLQPLAGGERGLLFFNPKLSGSDNDEEEYSLGLGLRVLCPAVEAIAGANVFYDSRDSRNGNTFDQVGAGLEILTAWVDARANYYWPDDKQELIETQSDTEVDRDTDYFLSDIYAEGHQLLQLERIKTTTTTTTRYFERFEAALEGYDAELGAKLPFLPAWLETRVFAGYYNFEGDFTEDIDGFKGRLEIRALPALTLDAEFYDNDDLTGSDYFFGARVNLPFDVVNLARGRNPFAGAGAALSARRQAFTERLSEMVIRDPHVRLHESGYLENKGLKEVDVDVDVDEDELVVLDDINFVNNGNTTGFENGTDEHPFNTVQEGVDNVFGDKNVYVYKGVGSYHENISIKTAGVNLLGEGCEIEGYGGETFGGGKFPVLDGNVGGVNGPVIRVSASDVLIQGFEITRTPGGLNPGNADALGLGLTIDQVGILAENADNLVVFCNKINGQLVGVAGLYDSTEPGAPADLNLTIAENTFDNLNLDVLLLGQGPGGRFSALVENNTFQSPPGGVSVSATFNQLEDVSLDLRNNRLLNPNAFFNLTALTISDDVRMSVTGNRFEQGGFVNVLGGLISGDFFLDVSNNDFLGPSSLNLTPGNVLGNATLLVNGNYLQDGIITAIQGPVSGDSLVSISGNTILNAGGGGITFIGGPVTGRSSLFLDNNSIANVSGGGITAVLGPAGADLYASVSGNSVVDAGGGGITFVGGAVAGDARYDFNNNVVTDSQGSGFFASLGPTAGDLGVLASGNRILRNQSAGFVLTAGLVTGDADIAILNSSFDDNQGAGLTLSVPVVNGNLNVLVDPTTANRNAAGGLSLALGSVGNLSLTLDEVTANSNTGFGIIATANSISGGVQAAFLDVEASGNAGLGLLANLSANDMLFLGLAAPSLTGNRIVANDNLGLGVLISGVSASGQVISLTERLETSGNIGGGSSRTFIAPESVVVADAEVVANGNIGVGASLVAVSTNEAANVQMGRLEANGNIGGGANLTVSGLQSASAFLGVESPFPYIPFSGNTGVQLNGNIGGGLNATVVSEQAGAGLLLGETEANGNIGNGLALNLVAQDQAFLVMGLDSASLTGPAARVVANNNLGNGIAATVVSSDEEANLMLLAGQANGNLGSGMTAVLNGAAGVQAGVGAFPFLGSGAGDTVEFSGNQTGYGMQLVGASTDQVQVILANITANSNAVDGISLIADGQRGATAVLGSYLNGAAPTPITALGNGQDGVRVLVTSAQEGAQLIGADLNASGNGANGLEANVFGREDVNLILGLASDGGSNILLRPVQANGNGGAGLLLSAVSTTGSVNFVPLAFIANSNGAAGLQALVSAYSNVLFAVGGLNAELLPFTVDGRGEAIGNGTNGLDLNIASTAGSVSGSVANVTANRNAGDGAKILLSAADGITATLRDSTFNQNDEAGFRLQYAAGTSEYVVVENVVANRNGAGNRAQSLDGSDGSSSLFIRNVTVSTNGSAVGLIAHAVSDGSATVVVENVVANNNFQGVDLYARGSAGAAFMSMSNVVANNNTTIGVEGDALADGGNAQIRVRDVTANNNGTYGVELLSVNSGASEARVIVSGDLTVNNNQTGALFAARSDGTAVVLFNLNNNVSASNNANHGIVGAAEGDFGSVSLNAGFVPAVNNNGNYGLVALAVGTNGTFANALNPSGTGNGSGNSFTDTANVGPWQALLP